MVAKDSHDDSDRLKSQPTDTTQKTSLRSRAGKVIKDNALIITTLVAIVIGFCLGLGLREVGMSDDALVWLGMPGELFLRCLKSTIVPLVICMVITCTATLDPKSNGKIAMVASIGFFLTHVIGVIIAIVMFYIFLPSSGTGKTEDGDFNTDLQTQDVFADLLRNILPDNVVGATISQTTTVYNKKTVDQVVSNGTHNNTEKIVQMSRSNGSTSGMNILGLITICSAVGIAANRTLSQDSEFLRFFKQAQDVIFVVMRWLFWTTPIGVASLIAQSIASVDNIVDVFYSLGLLVAAVVVGLAVHILIVLPAILFLMRRQNPYRFLLNCTRPFFIAFAATATSVAMPEMLASSDQNNINPRVSSFVIPMSVTLHADGSALYIASSALFLARTAGLAVDVGNIFVIGTLTSVLALAIPPVPSSSIVTLVIILTSLNVPLHDVALLFAVEWLLDRCRSGVNAVSHVLVAAYTDAICGKERPKEKEEDSVLKTESTSGSDDVESIGTAVVDVTAAITVTPDAKYETANTPANTKM